MKTNRSGWLGRVAVAIGVVLLAWGGMGSASAAPYTWNSTSPGNWDDGTANGWNTGGAYPNTQDDSATFSQDITANQTITINVADARVGTLTLTDATTADYGWNLSGANPLTFDSSSGTATVNVNGSGGYDANTHRISAPIVSGNEIDFVVASGGRLRLSGDNSGATGGMNISGGGSGGFVLFDSAASLGGAGNTITVASGAQAGLGFNATQADLNRFAGSSGLLAFANVFPLDHGWGYVWSTPASPAPNLDLTGFNEYVRIGAWIQLSSGAATTISGTFTPPSNTFRFGGGGGRLTVDSVLADGAAARAVEISGSESMVKTVSLVALTEANTYTGPTEVRNGVLRLAGASGSALNTAAFNVRNGAFLQLDAGLRIFGWGNETGAVVGNNNNRVADTTSVNLYGGRFNFFGNQATGTAEAIGALNVNSGLSVLDARWNAGSIYYDTSSIVLAARNDAGTGAAVLTAQSLNLNNGAQLWLRGVNLGVAGASASRVMLNTAPTMVGGGGAGSTTISIIPGVIKTEGLAFSATASQDWVTYDGTVGLRALSSGSGEYSTLSVGENSDNNALYSLTGASPTLSISSATTVNSLKLQNNSSSGATTISGTGPLTLKSGSLLVESPSLNQNPVTLSVPLDFNGRAGQIVWVANIFQSHYLDSVMSNDGGNGVNFTGASFGYFSGVQIRGNNTYTGPTTFNTGVWIVSGSSERLPDTSDLRIRAGATLTIGSGLTETVASLSGAGTLALGNTSSKLILGSGLGVAGAVTLEGASAYIAPGDLGTGTLTLSGLSASDGVRLRSGELRIDLNSAQNYDVLSVGSTKVTISDTGNGYAGSSLVLDLGFASAAGDLFRILNVGGATAVAGEFSNGDTVKAAYGGRDYGFEILYNSALGGGDGNDVVLRCTGIIPAGSVLIIE